MSPFIYFCGITVIVVVFIAVMAYVLDQPDEQGDDY